MLDESTSVAGKLTGTWKFKCPKCKQTHRQSSAIKRCAAKLGHVLLGNDVCLKLPNPSQVGEYQAAKRGILADWDAAQECLPGGGFDMPIEVYVRAETMGEATLLMLEEFQKFIAKAAAEYRQAEQNCRGLQEKARTSPIVALGAVAMQTKGWEPCVTIDGREFEKLDIVSYYLDSVPRPDGIADVLASSTNRWSINLDALDPDADLIVFSSESKHYGIKMTNGIGKLVPLRSKNAKTNLQELRNA